MKLQSNLFFFKLSRERRSKKKKKNCFQGVMQTQTTLSKNRAKVFFFPFLKGLVVARSKAGWLTTIRGTLAAAAIAPPAATS